MEKNENVVRKTGENSEENYLEIDCHLEEKDKEYYGSCKFFSHGDKSKELKKENMQELLSGQNVKISYFNKYGVFLGTYIGPVDKDLKPDGVGKIKKQENGEEEVYKILFENGKELIKLGYEEGGKEYEMCPNVSIMEKDGKFDWYGCHDTQLSSTEFKKDNFLEWFGGGEHISISYRNKNGSWKETYIGSIDGDLKPHGIGMQKYPNKDVVVGEFVHGVRTRIILFNGKKIEEIHEIITPGGVDSNKKEVEKNIMPSNNTEQPKTNLEKKNISKSCILKQNK